MRTSLSAVAVTSVALLLGGAVTGHAFASAVPETRLAPARLDRGAPMQVPHLNDHTIVDGDVRVRVSGGQVRLLGASGDDYVVGISDQDGGGNFRTVRVTAAGERTVLFRGEPIWDQTLSNDGAQVTVATYLDRRRTRVRVYDATDGTREAARVFRGSVEVLDADERRIVLGGWSPDRTLSWNPDSNATKQVSDRVGYAADISADRLATVTGDPYLGGCTVVTTLSDPRDRRWRSCDERVAEFSPGGTRMATIHILSDGLGPRDVRLRRSGGKPLAHYSTAGWFGQLWWEDERTLLLDTVGAEKAAVVRCVLTDCERATALRPAPSLRPVVTPGQP